MKKALLLIFILLLTPPVFSQEAKISLRHVGFGRTPQEIYIQIVNTGDVTLSNISVFIDGKRHKTMRVKLLSNKSLGDYLYLTPGNHLLEVRSQEGAYDALNLTVASTPKRVKPPSSEAQVPFFVKYRVLIGMVIVVISIGIIIWVSRRKPRLEL